MTTLGLVEDKIIAFFKATATLNGISLLMNCSSVSRNCSAHRHKHFFASEILMLGETVLKMKSGF